MHTYTDITTLTNTHSHINIHTVKTDAHALVSNKYVLNLIYSFTTLSWNASIVAMPCMTCFTIISICLTTDWNSLAAYNDREILLYY